jgi:tRNA(Ile)-lysidine synthase
MRFGVAVSGGADSVYLLHELVGREDDCVVLHVNHGLRGAESDGDEIFVKGIADSLGLECLVHREPVGVGNLEQEARRVRLAWFRRLIEEGVVERVALGHTLSDQAETVLFRFLRGAGTAGLAGIRSATREGLVRPLLGLTRAEVRSSLRSRGIVWREDSSNDSDAFARNRIRRELLPQLEREWNPELTRTLGQMADWAAAEESYWAGRMRRLAARCFRRDGPGLVVKWPTGLSVAVQRRLVRHAIETAKGDLRQVDYSHVEAVRRLKQGRLDLPGLQVEKSFEWLRLGAEPDEFDPKVYLEVVDATTVYNSGMHQLDWGSLSGRLKLRRWQAGDRYRRAGRAKDERLKLLFQKARVPVWERRRWPVLVCGDSIVWTREFGVAAGMERTERSHLVLVIRDLSGFPNPDS